ncbi:uncharacterized protein BDR25DRAFT_300236 [Lindgomyces ingoldianus]|uniref:Uncharacterized protein n=1 Tax=Lindgomyces ingoldianus TaxID=673940 RepID=A0ACB6RDW2_9PLEO|nr:uncharacterized protein BDR25DRAFT_300236 [Lindgomyces ingoldianus]KAF2477225.1 hypothetical protein BDR25DRAFT_300236 [Lindgomyces ingoldianus]
MTSRLPIVSRTNVAGFPKPSGTKLSTSRCLTPSVPSPCNVDGPSEENYPILLYDKYVYWPLSYEDGRFSFAIVRTSNISTKPIDMLEIKGAKCIDSIELSPGNESVSFIGHDNKAVSVAFNDLAASPVLPTAQSPLSSLSSAPVYDTSDLEDDLEVGAIVGIVVGSVLGAMITVIGSYLYWQMLRRKRRAVSLSGRQRLSTEELRNGEPDSRDRSSLLGYGRRGSCRPTDSRSIVSSHGNPSNIPDYGTLVRSETFSSIGSNPLDDGPGDSHQSNGSR